MWQITGHRCAGVILVFYFEVKMSVEIECRNCQFCALDLEDVFCAHEQSFKEAPPFGRSVNFARREGSFCGPNAKLYEIRVSGVWKDHLTLDEIADLAKVQK